MQRALPFPLHSVSSLLQQMRQVLIPRAHVLREPFINVRYKPAILFVEFLVYMLSTVGIWFGVSVYTLNPARCIKRRQTRQVGQDVISLRSELAELRANMHALRQSCAQREDTMKSHIRRLSVDLTLLKRENHTRAETTLPGAYDM